jgi:alginate O-acetyltransferase complex protein AlgI
MSFNSLSFILFFLPGALLLYYITPRRGKNAVLLAESLLFYAWGEPVYVILLALSILFNYFSGMELQRRKREQLPETAAFVLAILGNLLILGIFKYSAFFVDMINRILKAQITYHSLSLPLGGSFFTLQGISYLTDIRRGETEAEGNVVNLGVFFAMFPKIAAGPLVRYEDMRNQLCNRKENWIRFGNGVMYFIRGLSKKVLLADVCAALFAKVQDYAAGSTISAGTAWIGCIAFAFKLYFGFSGYADMAIGLGKMFGFDLPENFHYPYIASTMNEFWKRWHITFVDWIRDYVYEPLGGSRGSLVRVGFHMLLFTVIIGLFHGASLHYLVWGIYMGVFLFLERMLYRKLFRRLPVWGRRILFLVTLTVGWVFFFSTSVKGAVKYIGLLFTIGSSGIADMQAAYLLRSNFILLVLCVFFATPYAYRLFRGAILRPGREKVMQCCIIYFVLFIICMAFIVTGTGYPFLDFMG